MEPVINRLFQVQGSGEASHDALLSLRFGDQHAAVALTSRDGSQLHRLEYFQVHQWTKAATEELFAQLVPDAAAPVTAEIVFDMGSLSLLPIAGYDETRLQALHQTLYPFAGPAVFRTESIAAWQLYVGYPVPIWLHRSIETHFSKCRVRHSLRLALETSGQSDQHGKLLVDIGIASFRVVLLRNNRLQLFQNFSYTTPADVLYYLLKICQEQALQQQEVSLVLTGLVDKDSALYRELWQYFFQVSIREAVFATPDFPYPLHYFTTLNDIAVCVS